MSHRSFNLADLQAILGTANEMTLLLGTELTSYVNAEPENNMLVPLIGERFDDGRRVVANVEFVLHATKYVKIPEYIDAFHHLPPCLVALVAKADIDASNQDVELILPSRDIVDRVDASQSENASQLSQSQSQ